MRIFDSFFYSVEGASLLNWNLEMQGCQVGQVEMNLVMFRLSTKVFCLPLTSVYQPAYIMSLLSLKLKNLTMTGCIGSMQ